jgi:hypothetical protein
MTFVRARREYADLVCADCGETFRVDAYVHQKIPFSYCLTCSFVKGED